MRDEYLEWREDIGRLFAPFMWLVKWAAVGVGWLVLWALLASIGSPFPVVVAFVIWVTVKIVRARRGR